MFDRILNMPLKRDSFKELRIPLISLIRKKLENINLLWKGIYFWVRRKRRGTETSLCDKIINYAIFGKFYYFCRHT